MKVKPLGKRIVIKKLEAEEKTASGIVLPDSAKEDENIAEVLTLSKEVEEDEKNEIKVGDKVIFSGFAGNEVKLDGEEVIIIKTSDILGIIE